MNASRRRSLRLGPRIGLLTSLSSSTGMQGLQPRGCSSGRLPAIRRMRREFGALSRAGDSGLRTACVTSKEMRRPTTFYGLGGNHPAAAGQDLSLK